MKNMEKLIVSKPMKYNKNMDTLLFLLIFTTGQREKKYWMLRVNVKKNIEKTLFVSAVTQKMWKTVGSGSTLPQYLSNRKSKFPLKFIFT